MSAGAIRTTRALKHSTGSSPAAISRAGLGPVPPEPMASRGGPAETALGTLPAANRVTVGLGGGTPGAAGRKVGELGCWGGWVLRRPVQGRRRLRRQLCSGSYPSSRRALVIDRRVSFGPT